MKINGQMLETFTTPPQEEGYFLFRPFYNDRVDLLRVILIPGGWRYGIEWESYYAVANHANHNVQKYQGEFAKVEI